jgi:pilus assembly protein CpaB
MTIARIVVLLIALGAGGFAAYLASGSGPVTKAPQAAPVAQLQTVDVLVAKSDIGLGQTLKPEDVQWQSWPASSASNAFIRRNEQPSAATQVAGSIVRVPFIAGEPIREQKLVKGNGSGFMAAILPSGMRAVSTEISPETAAGGFVRVLAIDQAPKEKEGQNAVIGRTVTLELKPEQAETLARAHQSGTLSLALRSIADVNMVESNADDQSQRRRDSINVVRYGVSTSQTLQK